MMQAAVIHKYGKPDVFQIETVPKPSPRSDEVQIRVFNSSVNPIDFNKEGNILPNMRVLVTGATGGVGHFAVQIAKAAGCHVTGVCHSRNIELATTMGCDEVLPYDHFDFRQRGDQYDLIFDAVAKYGYYSCRKKLRPQGSYVSTVPSPSVLIMHAISKSSSGKRGRMVSANGNTADLEILSRLSNEGLLNPFIENIFPLTEIAQAHALSETEKVRGKIVIQVSKDPLVPS